LVGFFTFGGVLGGVSRLKELHVRANAEAFGARYPFDAIVPGGVAADLAREAIAPLVAGLDALVAEVGELREIYDNHAGVQDRFRNCGRVSPELAKKLGLTGLAGRASGQAFDLRCDFPSAPYDTLAVRKAGGSDGDVAARVAVRFDEVAESLRLVRAILDDLPPGELRAPLSTIPEHRLGLGLVEGWRGSVLVALTSGPGGSIRRCHPADPSWQNWPVLEHAIIDNIVPDFPLINKSFNLTYSGHDL